MAADDTGWAHPISLHTAVERLEIAAGEMRAIAGHVDVFRRDIGRLLDVVEGPEGVLTRMAVLHERIEAVKANCSRIQQDKKDSLRCAIEDESDNRWRFWAALAGSGGLGAALVEIIRWARGTQ